MRYSMYWIYLLAFEAVAFRSQLSQVPLTLWGAFGHRGTRSWPPVSRASATQHELGATE